MAAPRAPPGWRPTRYRPRAGSYSTQPCRTHGQGEVHDGARWDGHDGCHRVRGGADALPVGERRPRPARDVTVAGGVGRRIQASHRDLDIGLLIAHQPGRQIGCDRVGSDGRTEADGERAVADADGRMTLREGRAERVLAGGRVIERERELNDLVDGGAVEIEVTRVAHDLLDGFRRRRSREGEQECTGCNRAERAASRHGKPLMCVVCLPCLSPQWAQVNRGHEGHPRGRRRPVPCVQRAGSSTATVSTWCVCGNISNGAASTRA
jgi:hypothetical protein